MPPNRTIIIEIKDKHVTITGPTGLEEDYNAAEKMLYEYYQSSPTALKNIPLSEKEKGDIAYHNTLAEQIARNAPASNVPIGKRVV